jgi:simple sugar transport system permease protein
MLPLGIVLAVLIWVFFRRTVLGYELNLFGTGPRVARSSGVGTKKLMLTAMLGSGALAGMAGAAVVAGVFQADITPFTTNVGFEGILAALLARNVALAIPLTSLFFGAVEQGGLGLQIYTPISQYISDVLTATIIIFASARSVPRISLRWLRSRAAREPME